MTESCDEINYILARSKGWFPSEYTGLWHYDDIILSHPPDFCGDSKYTGLLLEELIEAYGVDLTMWKEICGPKRCRVKTPTGIHAGDTLIEAIARAAAAMLKEKNDRR